MIRHRRSCSAHAVLAAGATLLVTLAGTPTQAGPAPSPSLSAIPSASVTPASGAPYRNWNPASCATGGFGPLEIDADHNVIIEGTATTCGIRADKFSFTVVAFRPDQATASAFSSRLRPYAATGPTEIRAGFVTPPAVGSAGVCLLRSTTAGIACLAIEVDAEQGVTARPLSTEDPLVSKPVLNQDDALSPEPGTGFCATCVGVGLG